MITDELPVDYSKKQIKLNHLALKVDRENVKALIDGYTKNGKIIRTSIITAGKKSNSMLNRFEDAPKLITVKTGKTDFSLSPVGKALKLDQNYTIEHRYIAILDTIFHISNLPALWNVLCTDGSFDI